MDRRSELAANLAEVAERIKDAALGAGRDPASVKLIAVTKTWPASDVRLLSELGVTDVGENRDQEAAPKHDQCPELGLRWHFIGGLQRNKANSVARYADVVHSVDRAELVTALGRGAAIAGRRVEVCLQVSLDDPPAEHRSGAAPEALDRLAELVSAQPQLRLAGLMAVAPLGVPPDRPFARLGEIASAFRERHPAATMLSAGMSHDLEAAVAIGATHVRIGTAVLGARPGLG